MTDKTPFLEAEAGEAPAVSPRPAPPRPLDAGESLADRAYRAIEDLVVTMELAPGARVSEPALVERLGIGRTPVREALQRLASDGILVNRPRRGMVVCEIDVHTQLRALEARRALEVAMVRAAARRRTPAQAERLSAMAAEFRRMRGQADHVPVLRHDRAFIDLLLACAANPFLAGIVPLYAISRRFWLAHHARTDRFDPAEITTFHIRIGEAVAAGDEPEAGRQAEAFHDHIEAFARYVGLELS